MGNDGRVRSCGVGGTSIVVKGGVLDTMGRRTFMSDILGQAGAPSAESLAEPGSCGPRGVPAAAPLDDGCPIAGGLRCDSDVLCAAAAAAVDVAAAPCGKDDRTEGSRLVGSWVALGLSEL